MARLLAASFNFIDDLYPPEKRKGSARELGEALSDFRKAWEASLQSPLPDPLFSVCVPGEKSRLGRPSIWKDLEGRVLVQTVQAIQAGRDMTLAQAIRRAVKTTPELHRHVTIRHLSDRALQARYQEALSHWAAWLALTPAERDLLTREHLARNQQCRVAGERLEKVFYAWLDTLPGWTKEMTKLGYEWGVQRALKYFS